MGGRKRVRARCVRMPKASMQRVHVSIYSFPPLSPPFSQVLLSFQQHRKKAQYSTHVAFEGNSHPLSQKLLALFLRVQGRKGFPSYWAGLGYWACRTARHLCGLTRPHCSCALRGNRPHCVQNRPQCGVKIDRTAVKIDRTAAEIDRSAAPHCALSGRTASRSARNAPRTMKATALLSTMSLPSILG